MSPVANLRYGRQTAPWDAPLSLGVQAFIEYNGYVLNDRYQSDRIRVTSIVGLDDADVSDSREVLPGDDGEVAYDSFYRGRTFVMSGRIEAGSLGVLTRLERDLKAAFAPLSESPMKFRWFDIRDTFDDPQTMGNYSAAYGTAYTPYLQPTDGLLRILTTQPVGLLRTADNRLWGDKQVGLRVIRGSIDNSYVSTVLAFKDVNNYLEARYYGLGATNAVINPNAEHDVNGAAAAGWSPNNIGSGVANPSITASQAYANSGTQSFKVTGTASVTGNNGNPLQYQSTLPGGLRSPVVGGSSYTASAHVNVISLAPGTSATIEMQFWDANNNFIGGPIGQTGANGTSALGVGQLSATGTAPAAAATGIMLIGFEGIPTATGTYLAYFDDVGFMPTGVAEASGDTSGWTWTGTPGSSISKQNELAIVLTSSGVPYVIGSTPIPVGVIGSSVWLRGRTEGDLVTAELWNTQPSANTLPTYYISAYLAGTDADALGDQVLTLCGMGFQTTTTNWAVDDFQIESLDPGDVVFNVKKMPNGMSIKDSQDSQSNFNRQFQITARASASFGTCATQSRSSVFVPSLLVTPTLGFTFPLKMPLSFAQVGQSVSPANTFVTVTNRGQVPVRPLIYIYGAIGSLTLLNLQNNMEIVWSGTIVDGDYLIFDCMRRTLVNSSGTNMLASFSSSSSRWMVLEPGQNDIYLVGSNYSSKTKMVVYWKHGSV